MLTVSPSCLKTSCPLSGVRDGMGISEVSCTRHCGGIHKHHGSTLSAAHSLLHEESKRAGGTCTQHQIGNTMKAWVGQVKTHHKRVAWLGSLLSNLPYCWE